MKRILIVLGLLLGLTTGVAQAQTRVGVSLSFGDPYFSGQVVIGRPYYHRYSPVAYYGYRPYYHRVPVVVVAPRYERVVVVRTHRNNRRYHRYH